MPSKKNSEPRIGNEQFKAAWLKNTLQSLFLVDESGSLVAFNEKAESLVKEIAGKKLKAGDPISQIIFGGKEEEFSSEIKRASKGKNTDGELCLTTKKGRKRWYTFSITPHDTAENGSRIYSLGFIEITEAKQSALELSERNKELDCLYNISRLDETILSVEQLMKKALEQLPHGFQFPGKTAAAITCNGEKFETVGYQKGSQKKLVISRKSEKYDLSIEIAPNKKAGKTSFDFLKEEKDLVEAVAELLISKLNRINSRHDLQTIKERFEYAIKASQDVMYDHDMVDDTITLSENFQDIFGYTFANEPFTLEKWAALLHPDDEERINSRLEQTLADKKTNKWEAEFRYAKKDGTYADVKENAYIIRDDAGKPVRMVGIVKDITTDRQRELRKELSLGISRIFNETSTLRDSLAGTIRELQAIGNFNVAEIWLVNHDQSLIELTSFAEQDNNLFYDAAGDITSFGLGEGLPGKTWKSGKVQFWKNLDSRKTFKRREGAAKAGLKSGYGFPISYNEKVIGALITGTSRKLQKPEVLTETLEDLAEQLGEEIHRKKLEEELSLIFQYSPDIICIAGTDGYFKKINAGASNLLGYSADEMLSIPYAEFIHPEDLESTKQEVQSQIEGKPTEYFENRYITKNGEIKWLAWTTTEAKNDGLIYAVGKDITEEREVKELYRQASRMAKIGSWELNVNSGEVYLSESALEIFEMEPGYKPSLGEGVSLYKEGEHREKVGNSVEKAIETGSPYDIEVIVVTKKGNEKWVRLIGEAEFRDGACTRLYGSVQDIHENKTTQLRLQNMTDNLPGVVFQYIFNPEGEDQMLYISDRAEEIWGFEKSEFADKVGVLWDRVHEEDIEAMWTSVVRSAETLNRWHHTWRFNHPVLGYRWLEGFGVPLRQQDGSTVFDAIILDITEKKELEELLDKSNRMARIGSWELDLVNNRLYWTDITREIHEVEQGFVPKLETAINFYKEGESRQKITEAVNLAIETGEGWDLELQIVTAKGNERWIRAIGEAELVDGKCLRIFGSFQDIHDMKVAQTRLENIADNLPGIIFQYWLTPDGKDSVRYLSVGSHEVWGISAEEAMEDFNRVWAHAHEEDVEAIRQSIIESAETLNQWHHVWRYNHPDGSLKWQEGFGTPQRLDDGTVVWDSIILDVTEKKELEELLGQSNRLAKVGSWNVDIQTGQIFWSDTTREIFEVENTEELTPENLFHLVADDSHRNMLKSAVENAVESGESYDLEVMIRSAKGSEKWIRTIGEPEFRNGNCVRVFGSVQDIHDRKAAEEKMKVQSRHLEAISKLKSALLDYKDWYNALNDHLQVIGEAVGSDRVYYFENRFDPETGEGYTTQKLEWCREGITPHQDSPELTEVWFSELPELIKPMLDGKPNSIRLSDVEKGTTTRQVMENQEIKAFLTIPIYVHNRFHGFVGFDNCTTERYWSEEVYDTLKTITASLTTAISRQQQDQKLQELLNEKNTVLESISDAFYALDEEWNFTYFNREAEKLLEKSEEEVIGKSIWEVFIPAADTELYDIYHKVVREKEAISFEYLYPPQNKWYDIAAYPAENGISVYFKNIDDRKKEQQIILQKTSQLDAIALFNGLLIKEESWLDALEQCLEIFGEIANTDRVYFFESKDEPELDEQAVSMKLEWVREGISSQIENPDHHQLPHSEIASFITDLIKKKGYNKVVSSIEDANFRDFLARQEIQSVLSLPVFTGKDFRGFIGFDDCSRERVWSEEEIGFLKTICINLASAIENEDAEKALEEAFREKNEILESIGDAFFAVDNDWTVTYWNHKAEEFLGMSKEKIVGENLWDLYDDAVELEFYRQYHKAVKEQETVHFEEYYPATGNWFEVSAYPSASGLSVFFKDVTERKIADERLRQLNRTLQEQKKALEASNSELEQFAFVASHDLQEPLRMITSFLAQLERKYNDVLDERGKKYIHFATDGAKRMRQIILDLLDYSRVGRIDTEREEVDMNEIAENVLVLHRKKIEESGASVSMETLPVISAARGAMQQLMQNLVSNALNYQEPDSKPNIEIWHEEIGEGWKFYVKDNGIGIDPQYRDKIFNIFQRLHGRDEYAGTGVGLAICKKIVEDHGGEIGVDSEEGEGSTFFFTISK
jgi:PAS domain S-box-containing protein